MCLSIKVDHPECVLSEGEHAGHEFITVQNSMGYRCGYVRVEEGHPWHGKGYDELNDPYPDVHGGLTFAEPDKPCDKGGPDDAWWFGFDCAHSGDAPDPSLKLDDGMKPRYGSGVIRTQEYVEAQCRSLCEQAAAAAKEV